MIYVHRLSIYRSRHFASLWSIGDNQIHQQGQYRRTGTQIRVRLVKLFTSSCGVPLWKLLEVIGVYADQINVLVVDLLRHNYSCLEYSVNHRAEK